MRKATGKVVSLVLALALVITSFSATFASAATTESADSVSAFKETLYLSNYNGIEGVSAGDARTKVDLTAFLMDKNPSLETYDHMDVPTTNIEISSISVSGDNILRVTKEDVAGEDHYIATIRDAKSTGTATINVLYTGKTTDYRGDDVVTVRGSKSFKITVLDAATPILGNANKPGDGNGVSDIADLQKNPQVTSDNWTYEVDNKPVTYATARLYTVAPGVDAKAVYSEVQDLYEANESGKYEVGYEDDSGSKPYKDMTKDSYIVSATGTNAEIVSISSGVITFGIANPAVGNTLRLTVSSVRNTAETGASAVYVANKTVAQDTSKVLNKVVGSFDEVIAGDTALGKVQIGLAGTTANTSKSKLYVTITSDTNVPYYWDVTGADIETTATSLEIPEGRVGNVSVTGADSTLKLTDVTAGEVSAKDTVTVNGGSVTKASGNVTINDGATVGTVEGGNVRVNSGKVTGAVKGDTVTLSPVSDEDTASVGAVTADKLILDGTTAKVSAASFTTASQVDSGESTTGVELMGDKATIGSIDVDYYKTPITLKGFVGTIAAPLNAKNTGYMNTGAKLTSDDTNMDTETKATVSGNVDIYDIELNAGAVTFTGSTVKVANVTGSEADFIINAGALNITETIATSNTLKIADAADVKVGTPVFRAASDIAEVDSYLTYGYTLSKKAAESYDVFTISEIEFAGLTLDQTSLQVVKGETAVVTASVYPAGTAMPEGAVIAFYFNGDDSYVEGYKISDNQAQIVAKEYSADFDVLNKGTLTAVVEDEFGIQLEEYGEATCEVEVVLSKPVTETYKSDTTGDVVVPSGNTYQFKITSLNGQAPSVVLGSAGVFELVGTAQEGNDYFFKFQAVGASGAATGVYVNGDAKVATMYVDGNTGYTCDTTTVNVPAGGTYQVKITAASMPTLLPGNSIYTVAFASQEGNDYFFKITATSAQAGDVVGFYINGGARAFVATTV